VGIVCILFEADATSLSDRKKSDFLPYKCITFMNL